jgi:hypothetical protein
MTAPLPNLRYERKLLAPGFSLAEVLALVGRHPAAFRQAYPPRFVNNVYFDSPALGAYFDHVNGTPHRDKMRLRWYGPLAGHIAKPTLEHKIKRGLVSGKAAYPAAPLDVNGAITRAALQTTLDAAPLPAPMRAALCRLEPALVNRYQRCYYQTADGRFRLTTDLDLQFFALAKGNGSLAPPTPGPAAIIIELKFRPDHAEDADVITNAFPFRLARCSKYVLGIESLAAGGRG